MPELETEADLAWLKRALMIDLTEAQAKTRYRELIAEAVNTKMTLINDAAHLLKHA
jgi:hypothetical protein